MRNKTAKIRNRNFTVSFIAIFFGLLHFCPGVRGDEVDKLIEEIRPLPRYAGHTPNFKVEEEEFVFDSNEGKITRKLWVIKDGDLYVAVWHHEGSKLYVVAGNPKKASKEIKLPARYDAGGNTFDGKLGVCVTTFPFCYGFNQGADKRRFSLSSGWATATLRDTSIWNIEHNTEAVYVVTFRCDAVLGYVVEMDVEFKTKDEREENGNPFEPELVNFYPYHTFMQKMPDAGWRYEYTVYTPPKSEKYVGWINDFSQSDPADGVRLRNGGFSSFLFDGEHSGPALTCTVEEGISLRNATCNLQYDQHHLVSLPKERDINGYYSVGARFRLVFLPAEITNHIMGQVELTDWRSNEAFPVRIGEMEDFEKSKLPETSEYAKGYRALELSEKEAYSGDKSFAIDGGKRFRVDVQPVLEPNETYMFEARVKVVKGQTSETEAYLLAKPSQWIPKRTELKAYQSESVKSGEGWTNISLEFMNGPLGATYWLYVVVNGECEKTYVDDVLITKVSTSEELLPGEIR